MGWPSSAGNLLVWSNLTLGSSFPGSLARDYNLHHVCAYVRAWVTQFSLKLLQLHIFGKLLVLIKFYALQNFGGLVNFGLLLSE